MDSTSRRPRVGIVGAGPAGLTAAIAASRLGFESVVFERAAGFRRVGGGLVVHSNGQRVLEALGLLQGFRDLVMPVRTILVERPDGSRLSTFDYSEIPVPHNSAAVLLRADLQAFLLDHAVGAGVHVNWNRRCTGVDLTAGLATLRFGSGRDEAFDAVVAADGIHSAIRGSLGLPAKQRALGRAYLRGVAELAATEDVVREVWGRDGRRFGFCPLRGGRGYFYCSAPLGRWQATLRRDLAGWIDSWAKLGPRVQAVVRAVADWDEANYDDVREVRLDRWWKGRAFVVGDAAHVMAPDLGQGANAAMVDALVLLRLLAPALHGGGDVAVVGPVYQSMRRRFVSDTQELAGQVSWLTSLTGTRGMLLQKAVLGVGSAIPLLGEHARRLTCGFNPVEESYLSPIATNPPVQT
jgi:2-polyprenyl-6-methoxyphenol hydroxylase-like FAD-dependent oxidoreductase